MSLLLVSGINRLFHDVAHINIVYGKCSEINVLPIKNTLTNSADSDQTTPEGAVIRAITVSYSDNYFVKHKPDNSILLD